MWRDINAGMALELIGPLQPNCQLRGPCVMPATSASPAQLLGPGIDKLQSEHSLVADERVASDIADQIYPSMICCATYQ